jgi:hypothetical protein
MRQQRNTSQTHYHYAKDLSYKPLIKTFLKLKSKKAIHPIL